MSKVNKIFVVFLLIAGVLCLAIGTAFAVDFMVERPEVFACDLKRPVVAANRPFVDALVEPLNQWEFPPFDEADTLDNFSGSYVLDFTLPVSEFGNVGDITLDGVGQFSPTSNQYFYFVFLGDFSLYSYDTSELIYSFEFDDSLYQNCRLSFGVNENSSYFFEFRVLALNYANQLLFELDEFDKYLIVFDVPTLESTSSYNFYDNLTSTESKYSFLGSRSLAVINSVYKGKIFYSPVPPLGITVVEDIVEILLSGLTSVGEAMGAAFSTLAEAIFISGTGLSTFGILVVVFASISLGLSLTRFVLNFCTSWGKRNR